MVDRIIPDNTQTVGIPGSWTEDWPDGSTPLLTGHEPAVLTTDEVAPANVNWPALTPVTYDADGFTLKVAAPGTPAIGVTIIPVVRAAGVSGKKTPIYRAGCFNPALIQWAPEFDTPAKRSRAFNGAPTPTNIVIRPVQGYTERPQDRPFAP